MYKITHHTKPSQHNPILTPPTHRKTKATNFHLSNSPLATMLRSNKHDSLHIMRAVKAMSIAVLRVKPSQLLKEF
jgi:hypothetical protein